MINIFGDIAGNFKTFEALLKKMPEGRVITLGDVNDRGPRSKEMIQWLMENKSESLMGNHEHMFVDFYDYIVSGKKFYQKNIWLDEGNGGQDTLKSYGVTIDGIEEVKFIDKKDRSKWMQAFEISEKNKDQIKALIPKKHIDWLRERPYFIEVDNLLLTHAPKAMRKTVTELSDLGRGYENKKYLDSQKIDSSLLWNMARPRKEEKINIYGHIGGKDVKYFSPTYLLGIYRKPVDEYFAICLDSSYGGKLSALHYPTMEIYSQEHID